MWPTTRDISGVSFFRPYGAGCRVCAYPRLAPWGGILSPLRGWPACGELLLGPADRASGNGILRLRVRFGYESTRTGAALKRRSSMVVVSNRSAGSAAPPKNNPKVSAVEAAFDGRPLDFAQGRLGRLSPCGLCLRRRTAGSSTCRRLRSGFGSE